MHWGKLSLGIKREEKKGHEPFNTFLCRLDKTYYEDLTKGLTKEKRDIYIDVRCGLAHAYMIEGGKTATIDTGNKGQHGIEYDFERRKYVFWFRAYFEEFRNAVNSYITGLEEGKEDFTKLVNALKERPELI